jgi:hypothetical protein
MPRYTKKAPEAAGAGRGWPRGRGALHRPAAPQSGWYTQGLVKDTTYLVGFSREDRRGAIMDLVASAPEVHKWTGTLKLVAAG